MFSEDFSNHFLYCFRFNGGINFTHISTSISLVSYSAELLLFSIYILYSFL